MRPLLYIETTIPSHYCDERPSLAAEIRPTQEWWDHERDDYECFISSVVLDELGAGEYPSKRECLELVSDIPLLQVTDQVLEVAEVYQLRGLMPREPVADALHVALASCYRMDYLLTWDCQHLANANKARSLGVLNVRMDLATPRLITPHQLHPWEDKT